MIDRLPSCRCGGGLLLATLFSSLAAAQVGAGTTPPPVVPIHTAAPDLGVPYGVWAAGDDYKIGFHDGATSVPLLGLGIEAVHKRYQRALQRLRARLPESAFDELDDRARGDRPAGPPRQVAANSDRPMRRPHAARCSAQIARFGAHPV